MKKINIGLLGFGNVGSGTYETFEMNQEIINKAAGADIRIKKILVNDISKPRAVGIPKNLLTTEPKDILDDPEIDIVVEMLGGSEPALTYILNAMEKGKHVVTSNKLVVAQNFSILSGAASKHDVQFKMEGCVGGGIPILNSITSVLGVNKFEEILGILNGTTNYILTQMTNFGLDFESVLRDAQSKGFAEANYQDDIDGIDTANKLSILIALAFGKHIHPKNIKTEGIANISKEDIKNAKDNGRRIKLIANAVMMDGKLECSVRPMDLPNHHPLADVDNEFNAVFVRGNAVDELMFYGKGAGSMPTGSAVAGDILEIAKILATED